VTVVVLDLTQGPQRLDAVVDDWGASGFLRPVVWLTPGGDGTSSHRVVPDPDELSSRSRNECINAFGTREQLSLMVLVEPTSDDWAPLFEVVRRVASELDNDFGHDDPVPRTLIVLPWSNQHRSPLKESPLFRLRWDAIRVIAQEDSESPSHGVVYGEREAAVGTHVLAALAGLWNAGALAQTSVSDGPTETPVRLVRCWTRVIDGGYLLDHVARALPGVERQSDRPEDAELGRLHDDALTLKAVSADLVPASLPRGPKDPLVGLAYIRAFGWYVVKHAVPELFRTIYRRIVEPIVQRIVRTIDWFARKLGAPERRSKAKPTTSQLRFARVIGELDEVMERLGDGRELDDPPDTPASLWDELGSFVMIAADEGSVSASSLVGSAQNSQPQTLIRRLQNSYDEFSMRASEEYQNLRTVGIAFDRMATMLTDAPPDVDEPTPEGEPKRGRLRRWRRRFTRLLLRLALIAGVLLLAIGLFIPGAIVAVLVGVPLLGAYVISILSETFVRLRMKFVLQNERGWQPDVLEHALRFWVARTALLTYRSYHLARWGRLWSRFLESVHDGDHIPDSEQHDFYPSSTPHGLLLATGVTSPDDILRIARRIRRSGLGDRLYLDSWQRFIGEHKEAFRDPTIHGSRHATRHLTRTIERGLPAETRDVARTRVRSALLDLPPNDVVATVAPWVDTVDRFGKVVSGPPAGVTALGPVGRVLNADITDQYLSDAMAALVMATKVSLNAADAGHSGLCVAVGSESPLVLGVDSHSHPLRSQLVVVGHAATGGGLGLAGFAVARPGRHVLVAELHDGIVTATRATIERVSASGMLEVDREAIVGAPIVDIVTGTLLGIVLNGPGGVAAGPLQLRACVDLDRRAVRAHPDELDTALHLPLDVALSTVDDDGADDIVPFGDIVIAGALNPTEFLSPIITAPQSRFSSRNPVPAVSLSVDVDRTVTNAAGPKLAETAWFALHGRLMMTTHRLEYSVPMGIDEFIADYAFPSGSAPELDDRRTSATERHGVPFPPQSPEFR
jgi:hypothetical protein